MWVVGEVCRSQLVCCCPVCDGVMVGRPQVFFDLMREIRSRKSDDCRATNGDVKGKKRRKIKCAIL